MTHWRRPTRGEGSIANYKLSSHSLTSTSLPRAKAVSFKASLTSFGPRQASRLRRICCACTKTFRQFHEGFRRLVAIRLIWEEEEEQQQQPPQQPQQPQQQQQQQPVLRVDLNSTPGHQLHQPSHLRRRPPRRHRPRRRRQRRRHGRHIKASPHRHQQRL